MKCIERVAMNPVIRFENVSFSRAKRKFFERLTLDLGDTSQGSVTALVGISGVGKSSFLRLVAGLEKPTSGRIELASKTPYMSFLSQEPVIFEHLSPLDNALYLLRACGQNGGQNFNTLVTNLRLKSILEGGTDVTALSGGERQRLALLRALSTNPSILLLDEPCTGLDPELRGSVIEGLQRVTGHSSATVLYVTHHIDEIALSSDQVLFFEMSPEKTNAVKVHLSKTEDFLAHPPTLNSAKFALFPRCNILHGCVHGEKFIIEEPNNVACVSIAFLPTQVRIDGAQEPIVLSQHGGNLWLEKHGELIVVNSQQVRTNASLQHSIHILPGALLCDKSGVFREVLNKSLLLVE